MPKEYLYLLFSLFSVSHTHSFHTSRLTPTDTLFKMRFSSLIVILFSAITMASPIVVKREATPAPDYGDYGDYGSYGTYDSYPPPADSTPTDTTPAE
jgi:hypothetical protein